ncbi:hypothetical protein [Fibrobacter sp. UWEL]|uniref:hypothetical protein n=1 Tax=Fibrobacter sp. UWEL TaxID=1896209 RepID=UPI000923F3A6|nr:hypothetical protein [Fibrobacter sp. UWEL]SHL27966.1 hypothetical protein SAMN05720468_12024 [Fibrobacter sp. UWEL]
MNFKKIAAAVLGFGLATAAFAADVADNMTLKGNVQTQVTKSLADDDNNFSSGWIRANIGGQYKSESLDALIMIRMFGPEFGNVIEGKNYDKILADLYWVNYKWNLGANDNLNLKIGRWKTDWSQSTNFGTYIDKSLAARGLWMRDYSHNAVELGWKHGLNQLNAMVAAKDNKANTGYVRVEDDMKFTFPLELKVAYRSNLIDVVQNTSYLTHRMAAYASYTFMPNLRLYGEYACIYTVDEDISTSVDNYKAQELGYMNKAGKMFNPFYVGLELPTFGILTNLMAELEYIKDRDQVDAKKPNADELAWTVALVKTVGKSKLQFSVYSEETLSDVGMAFRLTTTIK